MVVQLIVPVLVGLAFAAVSLIIGGISAIGLIAFMFTHPYIILGTIAGALGLLFMFKK